VAMSQEIGRLHISIGSVTEIQVPHSKCLLAATYKKKIYIYIFKLEGLDLTLNFTKYLKITMELLILLYKFT
jgi:hypothetical protein